MLTYQELNIAPGEQEYIVETRRSYKGIYIYSQLNPYSVKVYVGLNPTTPLTLEQGESMYLEDVDAPVYVQNGNTTVNTIIEVWKWD